jgi:hypothetical protein
MPDRCTDPTCREHWPTDDATLLRESLIAAGWTPPSVWTPKASATILEDIKRATAAINAAPAYKHDCQTQGCTDE